MVKKVLIFLVISAVVIATLAFFYRYRIIQYSADVFIRKALPSYVRIGKINLDPKSSRISLENIKILNPPKFSNQYLAEAGNISCVYKMKGKNILDGIELAEPVISKLTINIERLNDGKLNLVEMARVLSEGAVAPSKVSPVKSKTILTMAGNKKPSDIVKIPQAFSIKSGRIIFIDRLPSGKSHTITFENIDAKISIKMKDDYSGVLWVDSTGIGNVNGDLNESVKWVVALNPTTQGLTMSNRFEASNLKIQTFEPYYDKVSPLVFQKGTFSGTLIFDFDNGNIGSTNEIYLRDFAFYVKNGYENASFLEASVPALIKYLSSSFNEIVFDFKIKGSLGDLKYYLGPITKRAIIGAVLDKAIDALPALNSDGAQSTTGGKKTDIEKAKEYMDKFKTFMDKKR